MKSLIEKIKAWWYDEYRLTVYYPGETVVLPDGSRVEKSNPKTYHVTKILKLTQNHIIFIGTDKKRHEIKVVNPVGFDLKKIY